MNHNITRRRLSGAIFLIATLLSPFSLRADIDKKFYKKASEKVWSMNMPQFNPAADLSDSIFLNQSGAFIARYTGLDAKYDDTANNAKLSTTGIPTSNTTRAVFIKRNMVKLFDASAIEDFTTFDVEPPEKVDIRGYVIIEIKPAFGARIIKPDGTIKEVNMEEALTVKVGKKEKDAEYKVAIPDLAPGDILDYFYYTEYFFDEHSLPDFHVTFLDQFPTKNFTLDCRVDQQLAFEYGAYNGAPKLTTFPKVDNQNQLHIELENIDALDQKIPYFSSARQMPFMHIFVLNNRARLEFVPGSARPGGIRHTNYAFLMSDIASYILKADPPKKILSTALSIAKDWEKTHPEATPRQIADACWMALCYAMIKEEDGMSGRDFSVALATILTKLNNPIIARIGVTSSRNEVPVSELANFRKANYMVMAADAFYLPPNSSVATPGELPAYYDGEEYVVFNSGHTDPRLANSATSGNLPKMKANANLTTLVTHASLDPSNQDNLSLKSTVTMTGVGKSQAEPIIPSNPVVDRIARYIGQKPIKPKKDYDAEAAKERFHEKTEIFAKSVWGSMAAEMKSAEIKEYGCTPDSSTLVVELEGSLPGALTEAGSNLMVKLGSLIGNQNQIKGKDRQRDISIVLDVPKKFDTTIIFDIPEGYELVESSLDDLNRAVITPEATFNTEARLDGRTVTIRAIERYPHSVYPASSWPSFLQITDALYDFMSASILLRPA